MAAAPICVLPAKDTVEEVFWKQTGMSKKVNLLVTLGVVALCYALAMFIPAIGDAITISGATTNPTASLLSLMIYFRLDLLFL